jgi:hypothetical protein
MALNLDTLLLDYNGSALAVAGTAEWGYIADAWKMTLPVGDIHPADYTLGTDPFADANSVKRFISTNFHHVRAAAGSDINALFVALLRLHIASAGTIATTLANRHVLEDEYINVNHQGANWLDPANNLPLIPTSPEIAKWVKKFGFTIMHIVMYAFASRGHHYKQEYDELFNRLLSASFVNMNPGFQLPSFDIIFRASIHAFGVKPLWDLTLAHAAQNKMAAAMKIRFSPSTPIAGAAHITTSYATINEMRKQSWWAPFNAKYHNEIASIANEVTNILAHPVNYHVAAQIFGSAGRTMVSANANTAFATLSPLLMGFIDHLGRRHPLSQQKAITNKSGGFGPLSEAFSRACDRFGKPDVNVASMVHFLGQL